MRLSAFHIKCLALLLMTADHVGYFLFPDILLLRTLGRFSFPLFAWLIANGALHTTDMRMYVVRLAAFALLSQPAFIAAFSSVDPAFYSLNIFFTLALGLCAVWIIKKVTNGALRVFFICVALLAAEMLSTSYGAAGVATILLSYILIQRPVLLALSVSAVFCVYYWLPYVSIASFSLTTTIDPVQRIQPIAGAILLLTALYTNKKGRDLRYIFYLFYPIHLILLAMMRVAIMK